MGSTNRILKLTNHNSRNRIYNMTIFLNSIVYQRLIIMVFLTHNFYFVLLFLGLQFKNIQCITKINSLYVLHYILTNGKYIFIKRQRPSKNKIDSQSITIKELFKPCCGILSNYYLLYNLIWSITCE